MQKGPPILVLNAKTKRETGYEAQLNNIKAAKTVADVVRTSLGPRAMLKMILSQSGQIVMTNDGHAILREISVVHPAAKAIVELARAQDENVGDGTTTVTVLAGELLALAEGWLTRKIHPRVLIAAYSKALADGLHVLETIAKPVDLKNDQDLLLAVKSTLGTKMVARWGDLFPQMAVKAVRIVVSEEGGRKEVDLKRYCHVEKIGGGELADSELIEGIVFMKDVAHSKMRRRIENPRIVLLDCNLEYQKSANPLTHKIGSAPDWEKVMRQEEEAVKAMVEAIVRVKPDVVITEKGLSDEAQHWLIQHGVTAMRRLRKTQNDRLARATGATIVSRPEELKESDVGTKAGLFEVRKIGDEYYTFVTECSQPQACTLLLRGPSKEVLNEAERNLQDALHVARNLMLEPRLCPGGGASEMAMAAYLTDKAKSIAGVEQWPYQTVAIALEVIPRTLLENCGADIVRSLTNLRALHAAPAKDQSPPPHVWGVNGLTGALVDMRALGVWEPYAVKASALKTAVEAAQMLLRVDDILSGAKKKDA